MLLHIGPTEKTTNKRRNAVQHVPIVRCSCRWLRYEGQSFGGVVSKLIGERDGGSRPRLLGEILTSQVWGNSHVTTQFILKYKKSLFPQRIWIFTLNVFVRVPVSSCSHCCKTRGEAGCCRVGALARLFTVQAVHASGKKRKNRKENIF